MTGKMVGGIALKAPGWGSGKRRRFVFDAREKTCRADYDTESSASIWLQWSYGGVERSNSGQIWADLGVFWGERGHEPLGSSKDPSTLVGKIDHCGTLSRPIFIATPSLSR